MSALTFYLAVLMLGSNFSTTAVSTEPDEEQVAQPAVVQPSTIQIVDEEQRFMDLVNKERAERNVKELKVDPVLVKIAREHSKEMADKGYFDHVSPTPGRRTALDRYIAEVGHKPTWALIGENLFYCSITDVERGHTCLMNSQTHRDNILNDRFLRIGVGIYKSDDGELWVTEMFVASID